jgi:hypothetical protein
MLLTTEKQTEQIKLWPSIKVKRNILKAQFFHKMNDSEMENELIRCWYEHHEPEA